MKEPVVNLKMAREHGLTKAEYGRIRKILDRNPSFTELGIFSVLWSEHCSYKSSRTYLREFPTRAPWVIQGPGENAGIVDIGDGLAVAMKIESHNHPSAIEPYQGAATGIGGILRDVFTMGARPIALLDPLYFGDLKDERVRYLFGGVVAGIGDYGNCVGVPTVGGTVYFDPAYAGNPLVNVMCVGLVKQKRIVRGIAKGKGNPILYAGATTGRDGIHGATFASEELSEKSEAKRPSVQIGDPFTKKSLLEACLELVRTDLIVGMQDMGAAGLTSSSIEMASRGKSGIELDLSHVPLRESGMTPYEIMLSESQERMVIVGKKGTERKIKEIFDKWGMHFAVVGKVTDDGKVRVKKGEKVYAEIPVTALVSDAPVYKKKVRIPEYIRKRSRLDIADFKKPKDLTRVMISLLERPTLGSKKWVWRQYDHQVRTNTVVLPGADASVLRIRDTNKAIALTTDCNGRYTYLNPYRGGAIAVAEAARNLACCGAKPLGITDCLNFGNPDDPEILWQFREAIRGMSAACRVLEVPIISGNVSFYNESPSGAVHPTPVVGMVGLIDPAEYVVTPWFKDEGDVLLLLGPVADGRTNSFGLGGSEYAAMSGKGLKGDCPEVNLVLERSLGLLLREAIGEKLLKSAHDCAEGGLGVALAECCFSNPGGRIGAGLRIPSGIRPDLLLFNESQGRVLITTEKPENVLRMARKHRVPAGVIGTVGGTFFEIQGLFKLEVARMVKAWEEAIPNALLGRT